MLANDGWDLTLTLLTWTIWRAPTNASKWRMGFNSAFKGLKIVSGSYALWFFFLTIRGPFNNTHVVMKLSEQLLLTNSPSFKIYVLEYV